MHRSEEKCTQSFGKGYQEERRKSRRKRTLRNCKRFNIFFNPLLFASCADTFSKWCKITRGMKRSASSTLPYKQV
jgi:hypothetical protein